MEEAQPW